MPRWGNSQLEGARNSSRPAGLIGCAFRNLRLPISTADATCAHSASTGALAARLKLLGLLGLLSMLKQRATSRRLSPWPQETSFSVHCAAPSLHICLARTRRAAMSNSTANHAAGCDRHVRPAMATLGCRTRVNSVPRERLLRWPGQVRQKPAGNDPRPHLTQRPALYTVYCGWVALLCSDAAGSVLAMQTQRGAWARC
jgi:hypothetical protein